MKFLFIIIYEKKKKNTGTIIKCCSKINKGGPTERIVSFTNYSQILCVKRHIYLEERETEQTNKIF